MKNNLIGDFKFSLAQFVVGLGLLFLPVSSVAQIPKRAFSMVDSICQTRMLCPATKIVFKDSIFYPKEKTKYQDRKTESYFFKFAVQLKEDIVTDLYIYINEDFSINYISGLPDSTYTYKPCQILSRYELWQIAKQQGLRTKFGKCRYYLEFENDGIFIRFQERKSKCNYDFYSLDAITGKYLSHVKTNLNF